MKVGISRKILILIEAIIATVIILGGLATFFMLQKVVVDGAQEKIQSISSLKHSSLEVYLHEELEEFSFVSKRESVIDSFSRYLAGDRDEDGANVLDILSGMNYEEDNSVDSSLLNVDGEVLISTDNDEVGKIKNDKKYFEDGKVGSVLDMEYDVVANEPVLIFAAPIQKNGELKGVLIKRVGIAEINKTASSRVGLGKTGETFLINSSNLVITSLLKEAESAFRKTIYAEHIDLCLSGSSSFGEQKDYYGDSVYEYLDFIPELKSCLVVKMDKAEVLSPIKNAIFLFAGIIMVIGLIGGILGWLLSRSLVRPIIQLRDETARIKAGNFVREVNVKTNDEIGDLAIAFNEMERKIKEEHDTLERQVVEKTKQLNDKLKETTELYSSSEKMNELMVGRELTIVELKKKISTLEAEIEKIKKI